MTDGPALRTRIERNRKKVAVLDERIATLESLAAHPFPPQRWVAKIELAFAKLSRTSAQRSALWAKRRLMGMVI